MLPFDRYREGGRKLLGKNRHDDRCRTKYGPRVFRECGTACVYCERELGASYDAWLGISVDHVIGQSAVKKYGYPADFIEDLANQVTCCRPCNEFVQDEFGIPKTPPSGPGAFFDLRDEVFRRKKEHALRKHAEDRQWYGRWGPLGPSGRAS